MCPDHSSARPVPNATPESRLTRPGSRHHGRSASSASSAGWSFSSSQPQAALTSVPGHSRRSGPAPSRRVDARRALVRQVTGRLPRQRRGQVRKSKRSHVSRRPSGSAATIPRSRRRSGVVDRSAPARAKAPQAQVSSRDIRMQGARRVGHGPAGPVHDVKTPESNGQHALNYNSSC